MVSFCIPALCHSAVFNALTSLIVAGVLHAAEADACSATEQIPCIYFIESEGSLLNTQYSVAGL